MNPGDRILLISKTRAGKNVINNNRTNGWIVIRVQDSVMCLDDKPGLFISVDGTLGHASARWVCQENDPDFAITEVQSDAT